MEGCIDNPYVPIAKHIILPKTDLNIINESNSTNLKFDNTSLWNKIESVNGDATAFKIHGDMIKEVSYNDFRRNSMDVAGFLNTLKECGADASLQGTQRIGVLVKNSAEGIMMIMGTYLAHMTSVIVDVEKTPTERITMIFKDAGVKHVLVLEKYEEVTKALDGTFSIFHWSEILEGGKRSAVTINAPTNVNHPFAIYYTSGTTGLPKGVMIELCNIMNLQNWWVEYFEIAPEDRCMLFSSLSFIMSIRQYIPPLTCGASVTIPKSAFEFESAIVKSQVNKLICTPSALAALDIDKVKTLDAIQVAGEPAQKLTMDLWMKKAKKVHIGLGPTELCAHAMCGLYDGQTLCIGKPAANVRAYVVNRYGNQCPLNCIGELWIAGANVSSGYLNRDAENKKHFSIDPFNRDGSRLYKTGDLCRRLADGRIQFIGRRDNQIKLNGYRIEIGDIQGAMGPSVKNSFIRIENGQLVAYVMPKVNISEVKTNLEGKLPTYMVPSHIIAVEDFPLNKNRKVDTDALSQLRDLDISDPVQVEEVETRAEKIVKMVWSEVLGVCSEELKQNDNFFSIGGTSLTAVILSRKLGKELSTDVSVHDVFRYQTILSFSEHIQSASGRLIHGMPDPLTFLNGGCTVMNRYMFGFLQLLGLILMTFLVAVPLLATTSISVRSFLWFGLPGILLFPTFVVVCCSFNFCHMLVSFL